jgi:carboxyl-terminal processing protease
VASRPVAIGAVLLALGLGLAAARADLEARGAARPDCSAAWGAEALHGVVEALDDPHTSVLDAEGFARLRLQLAGGATAREIGAVLTAPADGLGFVVLDVVPDSSAATSGLRRGDRILALDGAYLPALAADRWRAWRAASEAGAVAATVLRPGAPPRTVALEATEVALDRAPTATTLPSGAVWLRLPSFSPANDVAHRVHALVGEAERSGAKAIVVDLRDNPGGAIVDCLLAATAFAPEAGRVLTSALTRQSVVAEGGAIAVTDAAGRTFPQAALEAPARWTGAVVVLVNDGSASCAEFLALDLQRAGATVVGEPTAGAADSATAFVALPFGYGLQVTTARVTDQGGVASPLALAEGRDPVLDAALEVLANPR